MTYTTEGKGSFDSEEYFFIFVHNKTQWGLKWDFNPHCVLLWTKTKNNSESKLPFFRGWMRGCG
jgi:hypothetical protein